MKLGKAIAIALLAALATAPAWAIEPVSGCQALEKWVSQLDKLPADYDSFMSLDSEQRRAVYGRLASSQRAALWHRQLSEALAQDGWNENQRALIAETRAFASAENIEAGIAGFGSRHEAAKAAVSSLEARVKQAFSAAEAKQLFFALGPQAPSRSGLAVQCVCSLDWDDPCGPEGQCIPGGCTEVKYCGILWYVTCDGLCWI